MERLGISVWLYCRGNDVDHPAEAAAWGEQPGPHIRSSLGVGLKGSRWGDRLPGSTVGIPTHYVRAVDCSTLAYV
jgi:hypothetical protein